MKTEYEIYMDFKKAEEQANKLRRIARDMNSLADDDMGNTIARLKAGWTGDNSELFIEKVEIVRGKMRGTAGDIIRVADSIISIAERTKAAEIAAINISKGGN